MLSVNELMVGNWICFDEDRTLKVTIQDLEQIRRTPEMYSGRIANFSHLLNTWEK